MDGQQIISLALVALSLGFLIRSAVRKRRLRKTMPCAGDCGCGRLKTGQPFIRQKTVFEKRKA